MQNKQFELPTFEFNAGETKQFRITLKTKYGSIIDPDGAFARFVLLEYINSEGTPLLSKGCAIFAGDVDPHVRVDLSRDDTLSLAGGKYIYQISIKDMDGIVDVLRGQIILYENHDRGQLVPD